MATFKALTRIIIFHEQ